MGLAQSHADFFHDANQVDGDQIEIDDYLRRVEQSLWRQAPPWRHAQQQQQQHDNEYLNGSPATVAAGSNGDSSAFVPADPTKSLV